MKLLNAKTDPSRCHLLSAWTLASAMMSTGLLGVANAQSVKPASTPVATNANAIGPIKHVRAGVLNVAYVELGPADGPPVILLHGWPYDIHSYDRVAPALAAIGYRVLVPYARGYGDTQFLSAKTMRNAEPVALASDVIDFMNAVGIRRAVLGGFDWGARSAGACVAASPVGSGIFGGDRGEFFEVEVVLEVVQDFVVDLTRKPTKARQCHGQDDDQHRRPMV